MARFLAPLRARVEWALAAKELEYPWWVPMLSAVTFFGCVLTALWQRDAFWPPRPLLLIALVPAAAASACHYSTPTWQWLLDRLWLPDLVAVLACLWLILEPARVAAIFDLAPAALAVTTLEAVARDGARSGLIVGTASAAVMILGGVRGSLPGYPVFLLELVVGFMLGLILYIQTRALRAERAARASEHERSVQAERTRIAREIHDLVGHSLSVTLLHVTGARRLLAEMAPDGPNAEQDRTEALAALEDAEAVSRRAMVEIRRSIGTLAGSTDTAPLPTAAEVGSLVEDVRRAGQPVHFDASGDVAGLDRSLGLGIYRIVQESLSNVIKHAPGPAARVSLAVASDSVQVDVRNPLPSVAQKATGSGTGIAGMAARADQLGGTLLAGPAGPEWRVRATLPLSPVREVRASTAS